MDQFGKRRTVVLEGSDELKQQLYDSNQPLIPQYVSRNRLHPEQEEEMIVEVEE